jgi:outer membrane receptor for ferric coprogen and ferric-rhodotorulic acid
MVGKTFYDEVGTNATAQKSYGTFNAQLRYRYGQWTTTVYGLNIGDKHYYQFINPEIFAGSPGAPRRVGVQVSFQY